MVATVFLRIIFAGAVLQNVECPFKDVYKGILPLHQLLQIACATGNRIIDYEVLFSIVGIRNGNFTYRSTQMVNISETLLHTEHKRCGKGFQTNSSAVHCCCRNQNAERFGSELSVQEQTLFIRVIAAGRSIFCLAGICMFRLAVCRLDFSAVLADFEALTNVFGTSNHQPFTDHIAFAEVDLAHSGFADELITERELIIIHTVCLGYIVGFVHINQHLLRIEHGRAVIAVVTDETAFPVIIGIDHVDFQHTSQLTGISPSRTAALRTGGYGLTVDFLLCMRAVRAETP